ncbi:MAG: HlyD family efflux transporter periplasmic adaptor subunit [Candidatus Nomurabacteria bacterium]|nr:MAG: HlyD family efflux transporter periplasmic adaptor subunit [Candidatus Nomurabacteria bacterium]
MRLLFARYFWWYVLLVFMFVAAAWFGWLTAGTASGPTVDSVQVTRGDVIRLVTASARVEAKEIARLGFPVSGTIQSVYKEAGQPVEAGEVIASLTSDSLIAEYNAARERVRLHEEQKAELLRGAKSEERVVASREVSVAEVTLQKTIQEYDQAISNAWHDLLTTDIRAYPEKDDVDDVPPTISGNYLCNNPGTYRLDLFASSAQAGFSYRLSGMATGTFPGNVVTPDRLGDCGLYIKFDPNEVYRDATWIIEIPNKRGTGYVALKNAHELLRTQKETAVRYAEQELAVARSAEQVVNAGAGSEELAQADAAIAEAKEQLAIYSARIADYTIRAPFSGLVSAVAMKVGEPAGVQHTVTIVNEGGFDLKAKVPEIDITKVKEGASVEVVFDAETNTAFVGVVTFVSPVSTDVSGVSYYDAYISLDQAPEWMREGLNADVMIVADRLTNALVLPARYIGTDAQGSWVLRQTEQGIEKVRIETGLVGTNDTVEVYNLSVGTTVLLPSQ